MAQENRGETGPTWQDSRKYGLVDKETGEVMDALPMLVPRRRKLGEGFFMGLQAAFVLLAQQKLTHDACRVLFYFLGRMEYENHVRISQSEVVAKLGMDKSRVSRAVKKLIEKKILAPSQEKMGRSVFYKVNSEYVWRGKVRNRPPRKNPEAAARDGADSAEAKPAAS
ncbi:helix-turn-helix transcriptional regulator [Longimicrobium sp.]|uniref:helix-turn-helix transcriptional regulator n=1 Tax=Longimicrobium sp. TaxID=2029185 RepID=UPI003B3A99C2